MNVKIPKLLKVPTLSDLRGYVEGRAEQTAECGRESSCIVSEWLLAHNPEVSGIEVWPALKDRHGRFQEPAEVAYTHQGTEYEGTLPQELAEFIDRFDKLGEARGINAGYVPTKAEVLSLFAEVK